MSKKRKGSVPASCFQIALRMLSILPDLDANNRSRKSGDVSRAIKLGEALIDDYPGLCCRVAYARPLPSIAFLRSGQPCRKLHAGGNAQSAVDWTDSGKLGAGVSRQLAPMRWRRVRLSRLARHCNDDDADRIHYTLGLIHS